MDELIGLHGHPVFLRRDALGRGYDDKALRSALRSGRIARVRHGAYTSAEIWSVADEVERHRLLSSAVLEVHGPGAVLSHTSAVAAHGLPVWGADLKRVHLTRLDGRTTRRCLDVRYHRGLLADDTLVDLGGGHRATSAARAVLEHAMLVGIEPGLTTLDAYLNTQSVAAVQEVRDQMAGWPGAQHVRITLGLARKGAESIGETRMRYLCWENHLPEPQLQVPIHDRDGRLLGVSDFAWLDHRVLGEFDGKVKYTQYLQPGESPGDAVFREKQREDLIREATGCSVLRFVWADLYDRRRTAQRLRRALGLAG